MDKYRHRSLDTRDTIERVRFWLKVAGGMIGFSVLFGLLWGLTTLASYAMHTNGFVQ